MSRYSMKHLKPDKAKKAEELFLMNRVKSLYLDFPEGELICEEEPDFLIHHNNAWIGIELTKYIRGQNQKGSSLRRQEVIRQEIMNEAKRIFSDLHDVPLMLHTHWNPHNELSDKDIHRLASEVATLVAQRLPAECSERVVIDTAYDLENKTINPYIIRVSFRCLKSGAKGLWSPIGVGFVGVGTDEIQSCISHKDTKIPAYLKKCNKVWLVIVADGTHISSLAEFDCLFNNHQFHSQFDRVLLCDLISNSVLNLKLM